MPVKMQDLSSMLGSVNTASFLFGDEDEQKYHRQAQTNPAASPDAKTYLQLHANDDKFPILVRREGDGNMQLSASSAGMDLALQSHVDGQTATDRATAARHRQSLPPSAMRQSGLGGEGALSPLNGILTDFNTAKNTATNRRSLEVKFSGIGENKRPGLLASPKHVPANGVTTNGHPKLQSSYSTNDIPTLKSTNAATFTQDTKAIAIQSPRREYASPEQQLPLTLNNNLGTQGNRQALDIAGANSSDEQTGGYLAQRSALQASAAPFGPSAPATTHEATGSTGSVAPSSMSPYGHPAYYGGYGMQMLNTGFGNMYLGNTAQSQWSSQMGQPPVYPGAFNGFNQFTQAPAAAPRFPDGPSRAVQQRRNNSGEGRGTFEVFIDFY